MASSSLGCATCSVPDYVRTELRTVLAVSPAADRTAEAMHLSHVAEQPAIPPTTGGRETSKTGGSVR